MRGEIKQFIKLDFVYACHYRCHGKRKCFIEAISLNHSSHRLHSYVLQFMPTLMLIWFTSAQQMLLTIQSKKWVCWNSQKNIEPSQYLHIPTCQDQHIIANESVFVIIISYWLKGWPDHGICSVQLHLVESSWSSSRLGACSRRTSLKAKTHPFFWENCLCLKTFLFFSVCSLLTILINTTTWIMIGLNLFGLCAHFFFILPSNKVKLPHATKVGFFH